MTTSPDFYRSVPKTYAENLEFRRLVLLKANDSPALQRELVEFCRQDILFYVNVFCYTYDPRLKRKSVPFVTWGAQDKALLKIGRCVEDGRDLVIEKSRDQGATWLCLVEMDWSCIFHRDNSYMAVSRKEDLVDRSGDSDSLFWKIDFMHQHLPGWLLPRDRERRKLHIGYPWTNSSIDGEATTSAAGVGGRRTAMFVDEFSRIEEGYQLLAGTADTTRCRIFNFTPWGTENASHELAKRTDVMKMRLHWSQDPRKNQGLYRYNEHTHHVEFFAYSEDQEKAIRTDGPTIVYDHDFQFVKDGVLRSPVYDLEDRRRANRREMAIMWDIDYQGSEYGFFDRATIKQLQATYCVPPYWEGDISFDPDTAKPLELVKVANGPLKLWLHPDSKGKPPEGVYGCGNDLASGSGATPSCLSIVNGLTGEKVASYVSPYLKPEQFAFRAAALCWLFKAESGEPAQMVWEEPGPGIVFGKKVMELGFTNIYRRDNENHAERKSTGPGWVNTNDSMRVLMEQYRGALSSRQFVNRDVEALEETLRFVHNAQGNVEHKAFNNKNDPSGARVNHGDRVVADALAWKLVRGMGGILKREKETEVKVGSLAWRRNLSQYQEREMTAWS